MITKRKYREHKTLEGARAELSRLRALAPGEKFSLHCVTRLSDPKARSFGLDGNASAPAKEAPSR
jgi:hypothetical protein